MVDPNSQTSKHFDVQHFRGEICTLSFLHQESPLSYWLPHSSPLISFFNLPDPRLFSSFAVRESKTIRPKWSKRIAASFFGCIDKSLVHGSSLDPHGWFMDILGFCVGDRWTSMVVKRQFKDLPRSPMDKAWIPIHSHWYPSISMQIHSPWVSLTSMDIDCRNAKQKQRFVVRQSRLVARWAAIRRRIVSEVRSGFGFWQ